MGGVLAIGPIDYFHLGRKGILMTVRIEIRNRDDSQGINISSELQISGEHQLEVYQSQDSCAKACSEDSNDNSTQ